MAKIRIKAAMDGDSALIKCLMQHPMETGLRKDKKTGKLIPAHFIDHVTATVGGNTVLDAQWGGAISSNPLLVFRVKGAKSGDKLVISWQDNKGETASADASIA